MIVPERINGAPERLSQASGWGELVDLLLALCSSRWRWRAAADVSCRPPPRWTRWHYLAIWGFRSNGGRLGSQLSVLMGLIKIRLSRVVPGRPQPRFLRQGPGPADTRPRWWRKRWVVGSHAWCGGLVA